MNSAPNKPQRPQNLSSANHRQKLDINIPIEQLTINDDLQTTEDINIPDIPSSAPRYTETFLSTHFSQTITLLNELPTNLRACNIHFDNELHSTAQKLILVIEVLEEIEAEDWDEIKSTETGQALIAGMEAVEKEILDSGDFSDEGMRGVCKAAWTLMDVIDGFIGGPIRRGPDDRILRSFLEQDGKGGRDEEGQEGGVNGEDMLT